VGDHFTILCGAGPMGTDQPRPSFLTLWGGCNVLLGITMHLEAERLSFISGWGVAILVTVNGGTASAQSRTWHYTFE